MSEPNSFLLWALPLAYGLVSLAVLVYVLITLSRMAGAQERIAIALEQIADNLPGDITAVQPDA